MTAHATNNKIGKLYAGLTETERIRMLAKLSRAHDGAGMDQLRTATPTEHAGAYNRALRLLRTLNGNLLDWIMIFRIGMERDRFRLQAFFREGATRQLNWSYLSNVWKLTPYPITESEHRALLDRAHAEPWSLEAYAEYVAENFAGDESGLHPALAAALQNLPPELEYPQHPDPNPDSKQSSYEKWLAIPEAEKAERIREENRITEAIAARVRPVMDAAIKRGELPKPRRKAGKPSLPTGTLEAWGEGKAHDWGPGFYVPAVALLNGDFAEWDIRPDSEAEAVRARREEMRRVLLMLAGVHHDERSALPTLLDPPLTDAEHAQATKDAAALQEHLPDYDELAERVLAAATAHASFRAQLDGLAAAVAIIQREDFGGEDPLWEEVRTQLQDAQEEAERIHDIWESVNDVPSLRNALRKPLGLPPISYADGVPDEPIPLPSQEPDTDEMLKLVREWGT